jgi:threonine aldolase
VEANAVFAILPKAWIAPLQEAAPFYEWKESVGEVRLMCAWDTTDDDVDRFIATVARLATTGL